MNKDHYFLLTRDDVAGTTEVQEFSDADEAFAAYMRAERLNAEPDVEVVLIAGESLQRVKTAYKHYFSEGTRPERASRIGDLTAV